MFEVNVGAAGFVNEETSLLKGTDHFPRSKVRRFACHALHGDFQLFNYRLLGRKWVVRDILTILQQGANVASDRILCHFACLLERTPIGHDAWQGWDNDLVAAFQQLLIDDGVAVPG